jgi:hypothetical protein
MACGLLHVRPTDDRTSWSDYRSTETSDAQEDQIPEEEISFSGNVADTQPHPRRPAPDLVDGTAPPLI